jgi:fatty-acyl-CoA synthase
MTRLPSPAAGASACLEGYDPLRFWARQAPSRLALIENCSGAAYTYAELDRMADLWAAALYRAGVRRHDRVATIAGNRVEQVALLFACGRLRCALVPLNWRLTAAELAPILADAAPKLVFGEDRFQSSAESALAAAAAVPVRWVDLDREAPAFLQGAEALQAAMGAEPDAEDPLLVLYTSGSTGRPKGAVLPHRQLFYNAVATTTAWELSSRDVAPVTTPFFHTGGWNVFATPLWHRGGTVVLFDRFDAGELIAGLRRHGCTVAMVVPTQLLALLEHAAWGEPLPTLRFFISGGAPCPPVLADRVRAAGYGFREGYGLTECGPNCFSIEDRAALAHPGAVGWPVPFLRMRLVREDGGDAADGEPGELLLRGPQLFAGYLNQREQTREAFTADGWLRTGDLARRSAAGIFHICGRRKEMFISGGENVFPGEVEAALGGHPAVAEVVVVGVPDARWGEVGRALVVPRPGARLAEEDVLSFARNRLAGYKVPKHVVFLPEIPRLGSGKVDRRALLQLYS